jgi:hypothetical protein
MDKKINLSIKYEDFTKIIELMDLGLEQKNKIGEDTNKYKNLYYSLVNCLADNSFVEEEDE